MAANGISALAWTKPALAAAGIAPVTAEFQRCHMIVAVTSSPPLRGIMDYTPTEKGSWVARLPFANIDRSSWVSWASFLVGAEMARGHGFGAELKGGGPGLVVMAVSIAVFFVLVVVIQRHMRLSLLANTFGQPQQLVTSGWFRYSRNPIYVAFLIPLASLAYYSPLAAGVATIVYLLAMTFYVIAREEEVLERSFGQQYLDYKAATPRWVFGI